jgi:hypothetical protein
MTRKDYIIVAACIREQTKIAHQDISPRDLSPHATQLARRIALAFALEAELDNPRFDRARFLKACGLED